MDCSQCEELVVAYIKGHLEQAVSVSVQSHIESCARCRKNYEETRWLIDGLVGAKREIAAGHLSSTLLYDFVASRGDLDKETIETIESHLAVCGECTRDIDRIRQLISISIKEEAPTRELSPRTGFWGSIFGKRLVPVYSAIVVLIAAVSVIYFVGRKPPSSLLVKVVTEDSARKSGYEIFSLFPSQIARGAEEEPSKSVQEVPRRGSDHMILTMDVVTFEEQGVSYKIMIRWEGGDRFSETDVDPVLLESGRLWLAVDKKGLSPGVYEVTLVEHTPDGGRSTIVKSSFRMVE